MHATTLEGSSPRAASHHHTFFRSGPKASSSRYNCNFARAAGSLSGIASRQFGKSLNIGLTSLVVSTFEDGKGELLGFRSAPAREDPIHLARVYEINVREGFRKHLRCPGTA